MKEVIILNDIKIKVPKKHLESFCLDEILKQVKARKKYRKQQKALDKNKTKKEE